MKAVPINNALVSIALACGLTFGGVAYAYSEASSDERNCTSEREHQHWRHHDKGHHGGPMAKVKKLLKELDLSSEQRQEVRTILEEAKPEFKANLREIRANHHQLHGLIRGNQFDQESIQVTADAQGELARKLTLLGARVHTDIFKVLTDEQRQKAQKLIAQKHERYKMHH